VGDDRRVGDGVGVQAVECQAQHLGLPWGELVGPREEVGPLADVATPESRGRAVLALLLWNVADVLPVIGLPDALGWRPPQSSGGLLVGGAVVAVRAFAALVLLAAVKKVWQRWLDFQNPPLPLEERWWWIGNHGASTGARGQEHPDP
jgi:hypothetical protein